MKAIKQGIANFERQKTDKVYADKINKLARDRLEACKCASKVYAGVKLITPIDENIPEISHRLCNSCSCVLSWKLRQNIDKCKNWKE